MTKQKMIRNFICDITSTFCSDGRCKKDFCIIEREEEEQARLELLRLREKQVAEVRQMAEHVATLILKDKGVKKPTRALVREVARFPAIVDAVKKQVEKP